MRDPERIPQILDELVRIWDQNPDLRFGQIIFQATYGEKVDLAQIEDDRMLRCLQRRRILNDGPTAA